MSKIEEKFVKALEKLEAEKNVDEITGLFAENCEVGNVTVTESLKGEKGAREFWTNYRNTFGDIKSTFKNKIVSDNTVALEWTSKGTSQEGSEIDYEGVSILETDGDKITRFFAYFNPAKLGQEIKEGKANAGKA